MLLGTKLSFGPGTLATTVNPFANIQRTAHTDSQSSQTPTPPIRVAVRPFAFLAAPPSTSSPSTASQRTVADRRTAGRRSSIIASLRPQRPSIDRRSAAPAVERKRTARQRQQRYQLFQSGRPQVDGGADGSTSSDANDEVFVGSVAVADVVVPTAAVAATDTTIARFERESGVSCASGEFEYSLHNARTFEQLLQRMPSVQPFEVDYSTSSTVRLCGGSVSSETDADRSQLLRSMSGEEDADEVSKLLLAPPFNASSRSSDGALMVHQYLDRTRSIESLSRAQAGPFRLGRIPRRRSVALPLAASGGESADASMAAVLSSSPASSSWSGWTTGSSRRRLSDDGGATTGEATTVATKTTVETGEQQQAKVTTTVGMSVAALTLAFVMLYVTQVQQMMQSP